jgi:hypothetical protein
MFDLNADVYIDVTSLCQLTHVARIRSSYTEAVELAGISFALLASGGSLFWELYWYREDNTETSNTVSESARLAVADGTDRDQKHERGCESEELYMSGFPMAVQDKWNFARCDGR